MSAPTIQLDTPGGSAPPSVKFAEVGDYVVVGIVNVEDYQQHNIDGVAQTWSDGGPKMSKRVTGLVVSASGPGVTAGPDGAPVEPGDLVTFWCEKGRHFTWTDAVKAASGVNVGDVMKWTFADTKPPSKPGYSPQKVNVASIRRPEAKDGDLAERCVAAYHEAQARPVLAAPTHVAAPQPAADIEEPF